MSLTPQLKSPIAPFDLVNNKVSILWCLINNEKPTINWRNGEKWPKWVWIQVLQSVFLYLSTRRCHRPSQTIIFEFVILTLGVSDSPGASFPRPWGCIFWRFHLWLHRALVLHNLCWIVSQPSQSKLINNKYIVQTSQEKSFVNPGFYILHLLWLCAPLFSPVQCRAVILFFSPKSKRVTTEMKLLSSVKIFFGL